jgi:hypothetical protein
MGERRGAHRVLVGKPEGKSPLGKSRYRWNDSIKMDCRKWDGGTHPGLIWLRIGTSGRLL